MVFIGEASFERFNDAADCAVVHAQQRGECQIRLGNGTLLADFRREKDGSVSVAATDVGKASVEAWAD